MWWRFWVALSFLLATLIAGFALLNHTQSVCQTAYNLLDHAGRTATETGIPNPDAIRPALALWEKNLTLFSAFLMHHELNSVTQAFYRALSYAQSGTLEEYLAVLEELKFHLALVAQYDSPGIKNIL